MWWRGTRLRTRTLDMYRTQRPNKTNMENTYYHSWKVIQNYQRLIDDNQVHRGIYIFVMCRCERRTRRRHGTNCVQFDFIIILCRKKKPMYLCCSVWFVYNDTHPVLIRILACVFLSGCLASERVINAQNDYHISKKILIDGNKHACGI